MADETNVPSGGEPPKIKLNPGKTGNGHTDKIKLSNSGEAPPKIQLRANEEKKSTTRIDLGQARPPISSGIHEMQEPPKGDFYNKSTIRIDTLANPPKSPGETQRVPGEMPAVDTRRSTIRIDTTSPTPSANLGETSAIDPKKATVRTDLPSGSTQPMSLGTETARVDQKKQTMRVDQPVAGQPGETAKVDVKRSTIRIDAAPSGTTQPVSQGETSRIDVKKSTIRIDAIPQTGPETRRIDLKTVETGLVLPKTTTQPAAAEQSKKSETTRLELPAEVVKRQTGRIQIAPAQEPPDVFKRRTGPVAPAGGAPIVPLTPATAADTIARPKTIQVRRPPRPSSAETPARPISAPPAVPAGVDAASQQARKSETARLELPKDIGSDDRPVTRPKTIRIKRPDGTTSRKPLQIARPAEGDASEVDHMPEKLRGPVAVAEVPDAPGGVWTILTIAAFLMIGFLIYVIVAGDYMHDLPIWGRLV